MEPEANPLSISYSVTLLEWLLYWCRIIWKWCIVSLSDRDHPGLVHLMTHHQKSQLLMLPQTPLKTVVSSGKLSGCRGGTHVCQILLFLWELPFHPDNKCCPVSTARWLSLREELTFMWESVRQFPKPQSSQLCATHSLKCTCCSVIKRLLSPCRSLSWAHDTWECSRSVFVQFPGHPGR